MRKVTHTAILVQEFFQGVGPGGWVGADIIEPKELPVWMKQAAKYGQFPVGNIKVTLIVPEESMSLESVANLYHVFIRMEPEPALVLADDFPPKARGVLVRMGIPHVVSTGGIYAPQLGLAYEKLSPTPLERETRETLSPIGLKLTAASLLRPEFFKENPTLSALNLKLMREGDYPVSIPTLSKTYQQLRELELVNSYGSGPHKRMQFKERRATWIRLLEIQVETIVRRVETRDLPPRGIGYVSSGDSALGELSDLAKPKVPTVAMSVSTFRKWKEKRKDERGKKEHPFVDFGEPPSIIELWREDPLFLEEKGCLNCVELALSLRTHPDERVHLALAQILRQHDLDPDLLGGSK